MVSAKEILVKPISSKDANAAIKRLHYSGSVVNNSKIHFGVFLNNILEGVLQFGSPMDKSRVIGLVSGTTWNGMLELNRMAFSNKLPKNSESRAIGICLRIIKKQYPFIEWILSYADATQCGDGTIYRASGFYLTSIKKNTGIIQLEDGSIRCAITFQKGKHILKNGGKAAAPKTAKKLAGFQLRYIYFLNKDAKSRLNAPIIPFSMIEKLGASMYKGVASIDNDAPSDQLGEGGASPTATLQPRIKEA